jgi:hypothetical protein
MNLASIDAWIVWATTLSAATLTLWLWIKRLPRLSSDFLFLVFFTSTVGYLQVAPLLDLLTGSPQVAMGNYTVPGPGAYLREYAEVQVAALFLFQLPLLLIYYGRWRVSRSVEPTRIVATRNARIVAVGAVIAPVWFLWVALHNDLLVVRLYGAYLMTVGVLKLSALEFFVYRAYLESALFIVGIAFFVFVRSTGTTRRIAGLALAANVGAFGVYGVINSRSALILLALCLTGWWFRVSPTRLMMKRSALRLVLVAMLAGYAATIAVNIRTMTPDQRASASILDPFRVGLFGDHQRFSRLNCVDLVARLSREISREGAAWGRAWESYTWLVRRFVDPAGFDKFRLTLRTSAKTDLMRRYLRLDVADYYSCALVDFYGTFNWLGFLLGAAAFGAVFRFYRTATVSPPSGTVVILGLFAMTSALYFDTEAATIFLGWVRKAPVLLAAIALHPLTVEPVR